MKLFENNVDQIILSTKLKYLIDKLSIYLFDLKYIFFL